MPIIPIKDRGYAHPELLVESEWLAERLGDRKVRIVDARPADQYTAGHVPGAVSLALAGTMPRASDGDMGAAEDFAKLAGKLGIDNDSTVVAYEGTQAGMLVWALRHFGHRDARLLDGGITKWSAENRYQSKETSSYASGSFLPKTSPADYCSLSQAKAYAGDKAVVFWDVRSPDEYTGGRAIANLPPERHGHVPNAINLDWNELFDPVSKTMKSASECRGLLLSRGLKPEAEIVTY